MAFASPALAVTNIQASVCGDFNGPSISSPLVATETQATSFVIEGIGDPGMTVVTMNGSTPSGSTTVTAGGLFALQVPLVPGDNVFVVRETDNCGTAKEVTSERIHRTVPVEVPSQPSTEQPSSNPAQPQAPLALQPTVPITPTKEQESTTGATDGQGYPKPTIVSPMSGAVVNGNRMWVAGMAKAKSTVTIYINGQEAAHVVASEKGEYGVLVDIKPGKNTIQVRSEMNGISSLSDSREVTFVPKKSDAATEDSLLVKIFKTAVVTTTIVTAVGGGTWAASRIRLRWFKP